MRIGAQLFTVRDFCKDLDSTDALPVFNRTVPLKDSWAKEAKK